MMRYFIIFVLVIIGLRVAGQVSYLQPKQKAPDSAMVAISQADRWVVWKKLQNIVRADSLQYDHKGNSLSLRDGEGVYYAPRIILVGDDYNYCNQVPDPRKYDIFVAFDTTYYYTGDNWLEIDLDKDRTNEGLITYDSVDVNVVGIRSNTNGMDVNPVYGLDGIKIRYNSMLDGLEFRVDSSKYATQYDLTQITDNDTQDLSIDSLNRVFTIALTNGGTVKWKDIDTNSNPLDSTVLNSGYGIYAYEVTPNNWNIEADTSEVATPYDLTLVDTDDQYLGSNKAGNQVTVYINDGSDAVFSVADQDSLSNNEIQQIDTFSLVGNEIRISLSKDSTIYKSINLPADQNTTYSAGFGLGLTGSTFFNSRYWKLQDSLFVKRFPITATAYSNPFDDAIVATRVDTTGNYQINFNGASANMITSYVGGSASVFQIGSHYNGSDYYMRTRTDGSTWRTWKRLWHSGDFSATDVSHWNTAYGWGNHASAGYALNSSLSNYLPLSGGTMSNTNLVTNLNADLLDGYSSAQFVFENDVLMNTNPFGGKRLYINSLDNYMFAADKKWYVTATTHAKSYNGDTYPKLNPAYQTEYTYTGTNPYTVNNAPAEVTVYNGTTVCTYVASAPSGEYQYTYSGGVITFGTNPSGTVYVYPGMTITQYLDSPVLSTTNNPVVFDGSYESFYSIASNSYAKIRITFSADATAGCGTYPYGNYFLSYYYSNTSDSAYVRQYNRNYQGHGVGWHIMKFSDYKNTNASTEYIQYVTPQYDYGRSIIEFIVMGHNSHDTYLTEVDWKLNRPNLSNTGSTVTKYGDNKLYYSLNFGDQTTNKLILNPNGIITSNVTNGTAPFTITSSTVNTNLNADLLDGNHASAFQTALTNPVTGTGTTNYLPKFTGTSTLGNSLVYDNGTNVGIGNTDPQRALHVTGEVRITDLVTDTPTQIVGADNDGDLDTIGVASGLTIASGTLKIDTSRIATQYDLTSSNYWQKNSTIISPKSTSESVAIGGAGNSAYKLFVDGRIRFDNLNTGTATSLIGRDVNNELVSTTDNSTNWNTAYNDKITGVGVSGTTTKTITLTQQDGGTVTGNFTDLDTDAQDLSLTNTTLSLTGDGTNTSLNPLLFKRSTRDFSNGTLIQTNIDYSVTNGAAWLLEIKGNGYQGGTIIDSKFQGYIYGGTMIALNGIQNGYQLTGIVAFNYNGNLCFWFPYQQYWQGYDVFVSDVTSSYDIINKVTSITNEAKPGGITKEVTLLYINTSGAGTVTNVSATSPITSSGGSTPNISIASGYTMPTTTQVTNWNSAYGWGNHANAGYLTSLSGALLATGATTGATSQAQTFTNGTILSNLTAYYVPYADSNKKLVSSPIKSDGTNVGIGVTSPTAVLHLKAGTATASTAPLKFTSGTNLTTPENGAMEYDGTHFYGTAGGTRYQLDNSNSFSGAGSTNTLAKWTSSSNLTYISNNSAGYLYGNGTGGFTFDNAVLSNTLVDGKIFVGNSSNVAVAQTLSGEGTITNTAVLSLTKTATLASNPNLGASKAGFASSGIIFEGSTNDNYETVLEVEDPTLDRVITLPNYSGILTTTNDLGFGRYYTTDTCGTLNTWKKLRLTSTSILSNGIYGLLPSTDPTYPYELAFYRNGTYEVTVNGTIVNSTNNSVHGLEAYFRLGGTEVPNAVRTLETVQGGEYRKVTMNDIIQVTDYANQKLCVLFRNMNTGSNIKELYFMNNTYLTVKRLP